jgi:hypothetical protein
MAKKKNSSVGRFVGSRRTLSSFALCRVEVFQPCPRFLSLARCNFLSAILSGDLFIT